MDIYKPNEFAALVGGSVKTLQLWDNDGKLKAYRSPSIRRYCTQKQYRDYLGDGNSKQGKTILYTRVSTANQKNDLLKQVAFLKQYANSKGMVADEVLEVQWG